MNSSIHVDALNALIDSSNIKMLFNERDNIRVSKSFLEDFINNKNILLGKEWDKVRIKLDKYEELLKKREDVSSVLSSTINSSVKLLLEYLGDDLYLDISMLDEMKENKRQIEVTINELELAINSKTMSDIMMEDGTYVSKEIYVYDYEQRMEFQDKINLLRNEILPEINRIISKIEGLQIIYDKVNLMMDDALEYVRNFKSEIGSVIPSEKVIFNPNL